MEARQTLTSLLACQGEAVRSGRGFKSLRRRQRCEFAWEKSGESHSRPVLCTCPICRAAHEQDHVMEIDVTLGLDGKEPGACE